MSKTDEVTIPVMQDLDERDWYKCQDCKRTFHVTDAPLKSEPEHLSGRPTVWINYALCPHCGRDDLIHPDVNEIIKASA